MSVAGNYRVLRIDSSHCYDWLTRVHYAKRIPPISHAFGLYSGPRLMGCITYGMPSSAPLREGIAGRQYSNLVLELNRLVLEEPIKNGASRLVGASLRMLPRPSIVVSYADTAQGHVGYVYQACNFLYTGLSAKRTDWKIKGKEHLHGQTIADMSAEAAGGERGSRAAFMREKFGEDFYLEDRPRKHRYIYVCAKGKTKRDLLAAIKYDAMSYPKGDSARYEINAAPVSQLVFI